MKVARWDRVDLLVAGRDPSVGRRAFGTSPRWKRTRRRQPVRRLRGRRPAVRPLDRVVVEGRGRRDRRQDQRHALPRLRARREPLDQLLREDAHDGAPVREVERLGLGDAECRSRSDRREYTTSNSLAFDDQGNPAIAYGVRTGTGDRSDTLKLARWTGSAWKIEVVEEGVLDYGHRSSLAFDVQGMPAIAHGIGARGSPGSGSFAGMAEQWVRRARQTRSGSRSLVLRSVRRAARRLHLGVPWSAWMARREAGRGWTAELVEGSLECLATCSEAGAGPRREALARLRKGQAGIDGISVQSIGFARRTAP